MKNAELSWQQGQPSSTHFDDVYFSAEDGLAETEHVFLAANDLPALWQGKPQFVIAESGFGSGLNFFTTLQCWLDNTETEQHLFYYSAELLPFKTQDLKMAMSLWPQFNTLVDELLSQYPPTIEGFHLLHLCNGRVTLCLMWGDILHCLQQCRAQVDAWFLDGFAPAKNEAMWSPAVFEQISRLSKKGTRLSTFTAAGFVRRGLIEVGFEVKKVPAHGRKRDMLSAVMQQPVVNKCQKPWFRLAPYKAAKHAVIVGAGIAGLTTAKALMQRGWQVSLVEQHAQAALQASGNAQALVMPRLSLQTSADSTFYHTAFCYAVAQLNKLKTEGFDGWQQSGVLQLACTSRQRKQIEKHAVINHYIEKLNAQQASKLSQININTDVLWFVQAGYCEAKTLCEFLYQQIKEQITGYFNTPIRQIKFAQQQWQLFTQDGQVTSADAVILCNAYQTKQLQQSEYLDIEAARGQVSFVADNSCSRPLCCPVVYDGYVMPSQQGRHLLGASFMGNNSNAERQLTDDQDNIKKLQQVMPDIFESSFMPSCSRASVRAVSHDRMPLVGALADKNIIIQQYADLYKGRASHVYDEAQYYAGLYINAAHGARGFVSSFLSAQIIAAQLNNEPLPVSSEVAEALHPSRSMIKRCFKRQY